MTPTIDTKYELRNLASITELCELYKGCYKISNDVDGRYARIFNTTFDVHDSTTLRYIEACILYKYSGEAYSDYISDLVEFGDDIFLYFPNYNDTPFTMVDYAVLMVHIDYFSDELKTELKNSLMNRDISYEAETHKTTNDFNEAFTEEELKEDVKSYYKEVAAEIVFKELLEQLPKTKHKKR